MDCGDDETDEEKQKQNAAHYQLLQHCINQSINQSENNHLQNDKT